MAIGRGKRAIDGRALLVARYGEAVGIENVIEIGGVVSGPCPAHTDGRPSFRIFRDGRGRPWAKCYAGCSEDDILEVLGLRWQDIRSDEGRPDDSLADERAELFDISEYLNAVDSTHLIELSTLLGDVPVEVFANLSVGWSNDRSAWTFPECSSTGEPVTVLYRSRDGSKLAAKGRPRGLYIPVRQAAGDTLWVAEGVSDLCALLAMGLPAIARHAAIVSELKSRHIVEYAAGRFEKIVVIGDYDSKPSGKWPGREGAVGTAGRLVRAGATVRGCGWTMPPGGGRYKDVRDWWIASGSSRGADEFLAGISINKAESVLRESFLPQPENRAEMQLRQAGEKFLVEDMFVEHEPLFVVGVAKSLKTTLMIDLAVSLTEVKPFLGKFPVVGDKRKVLIFSGESGVVTLAKLIDRVSRSKGVDAFANDRLVVSFASPQLSRDKSLDAVRQMLDAEQPDVVVIDPLYTALFSGKDNLSASNVTDVGSVLNGFVQVVNSVKATPVIVHHMKKAGGINSTPNIFDTAMAGVVEFMRQWLLIGRTRIYNPGAKRHHLKVVYGGARGYEGQCDLLVNEEKDADGEFTYSTTVDDDNPTDDGPEASSSCSITDVLDGVKFFGGFTTLRKLREVCDVKHLAALVEQCVTDGTLEWRNGDVSCGVGKRNVHGVGVIL